MSNRQLTVILAFLVPILISVSGSFLVSDLAVWIALGKYWLAHHELMRQDTFSVLSTSPMIYPSWAISILYALLYQAGGLLLACLFHPLVVLPLLLWIIYRSSILDLENPSQRGTRSILMLFSLATMDAFSPRPAMIALIPLVLAYLEISAIRHHLSWKQVARLCALGIAWVNLHGSFILLPILLAWRLAFQREIPLSKRLAALLATLAALLVNPWREKIFTYVLDTVRISRHRYLTEWTPTGLLTYFPTGLLFWALAGFVTAWAILESRKANGRHPICRLFSSPFFPLLLNGALAIRNSALAFATALPFFRSVGILESRRSASVPERRGLNLFVVIATSIAILAPVLSLVTGMRPAFDHTAPEKLVARIRASGRTCPIFDDFETGGFLLLELPNRIFLDARGIIFSDEDFRQYLDASRAKPGWKDYLDRYGACFAILSRESEGPLVEAMQSSAEWKLISEEKRMLLFEKNP